MKIQGSQIADLGLGTEKELTAADYEISLDADIVATIPTIAPLTVSAAGSVETVQSSFLKSNLVLALAPAQAQTITDFVTVSRGLWKFRFILTGWFDYNTVAGGAKSLALAFLPTDTGQTTQFFAMFAMAGTQIQTFECEMLLRKGGTFRAVLGPTLAAQNISAAVTMIGNKIL